MRKLSLKTLQQKSRKFRNEQAIMKLVEREEKADTSFYGKPMEIKKEKSRNPFKIGSLWLSILP